VKESRSRKIPVLLGTLVSNDCDLPPFRGVPDSTHVDRSAVQRELEQGMGFLAEGRAADARAAYHSALQKDSGNAGAWYGYACAQLQSGDTAGARHSYEGARDRDVIRFRAPSDFNAVIRSVGHSPGAALVDVESLFVSRSPRRIIGNELLCDHLHPNPDGYFLMANGFFQAICELGILPGPDTGFVLPAAPYGVTALDWEIGDGCVRDEASGRFLNPPSRRATPSGADNRSSHCASTFTQYLSPHHAMAEYWLG
jgi:hypothetical protein